jgi:ketosteroid isomerase-like protein
MELTNVDRLRAAYEALDRGDAEAIRNFLHPQVELFDRPEIPDAGSYVGWEGLMLSVGASRDSFEDFHFTPQRFFERGDRVVVIVLMTGRGKSSGVPVKEQIAHDWTLRDGRAVRLQAYTDPADALEAAGLARDLMDGA